MKQTSINLSFALFSMMQT